MDYDSIYDYRETHSDYRELLCEHKNTELYQEIIHCMNWLNPEWNTNYGIGEISAEFILTTINNLDYIEFNNENSKENLKSIYLEIKDSYTKSKAWYQSRLPECINNKFEEEYTDETDLDELSDKDYNKLYSAFSKKIMSKIYYEF